MIASMQTTPTNLVEGLCYIGRIKCEGSIIKDVSVKFDSGLLIPDSVQPSRYIYQNKFHLFDTINRGGDPVEVLGGTPLSDGVCIWTSTFLDSNMKMFYIFILIRMLQNVSSPDTSYVSDILIHILQVCLACQDALKVTYNNLQFQNFPGAKPPDPRVTGRPRLTQPGKGIPTKSPPLTITKKIILYTTKEQCPCQVSALRHLINSNVQTMCKNYREVKIWLFTRFSYSLCTGSLCCFH